MDKPVAHKSKRSVTTSIWNCKAYYVYWDEDQSFRLKTNFSWTNACSTLYARTVYKTRAVLSGPTNKQSKVCSQKFCGP